MLAPAPGRVLERVSARVRVRVLAQVPVPARVPKRASSSTCDGAGERYERAYTKRRWRGTVHDAWGTHSVSSAGSSHTDTRVVLL